MTAAMLQKLKVELERLAESRDARVRAYAERMRQKYAQLLTSA